MSPVSLGPPCQCFSLCCSPGLHTTEDSLLCRQSAVFCGLLSLLLPPHLQIPSSHLKLDSLSNPYQLVFSRGSRFRTPKRRSYAKCSQRGAFLETLVDPGQGVKVQSSRVKENFIIPKGQFDLRSTKRLISHTHKRFSLSIFSTYIGFHSFSIRLYSLAQTLSSNPPPKPP